MNTVKSINRSLLIINFTLALLWIYQGFVPKIIYSVVEEQLFWEFTGINVLPIFTLIKISGFIEIIFGMIFLIFKTSKLLHYLNIIGMILLAGVVVILYPQYFTHAFNPFVMNLAMAILSVIAIQLINISQNFKTK